jgi:hypothetical protein
MITLTAIEQESSAPFPISRAETADDENNEQKHASTDEYRQNPWI